MTDENGEAVYYSGRPNYGNWAVTVHQGFSDRPLHHDVRHSPDGFSWGYGGSGPSELARCLLLDATGNDTGYQQFKFDVVARWPMDEGWTMPRAEVKAWQRAYLDVMSRS